MKYYKYVKFYYLFNETITTSADRSIYKCIPYNPNTIVHNVDREIFSKEIR